MISEGLSVKVILKLRGDYKGQSQPCMGLGQSIVDTAKERALRGYEPGMFEEQKKRLVCLDLVSKRRIEQDEARELSRGQIWVHLGHDRKFGFLLKSNGKPLENFNQGNDMISSVLL